MSTLLLYVSLAVGVLMIAFVKENRMTGWRIVPFTLNVILYGITILFLACFPAKILIAEGMSWESGIDILSGLACAYPVTFIGYRGLKWGRGNGELGAGLNCLSRRIGLDAYRRIQHVVGLMLFTPLVCTASFALSWNVDFHAGLTTDSLPAIGGVCIGLIAYLILLCRLLLPLMKQPQAG